MVMQLALGGLSGANCQDGNIYSPFGNFQCIQLQSIVYVIMLVFIMNKIRMLRRLVLHKMLTEY